MIAKRRHIVGEERQLLAKDLVKRYAEGESIRELASSTGRSYGFVHRVLLEAGVTLRQRGGGMRHRVASHEQLAATLAARHPRQRLTGRQAEATLREVYGACSSTRAHAACTKHNDRVARAKDEKP